MNSIWSTDLGKSFRPMYIFTILAVLLVFTLVLLAFVMKNGTDNQAVVAVLNTAAGGLLTLIGAVVNYEFGSAKPREPLKAPPGTTVEQTTTTTATGTEQKS